MRKKIQQQSCRPESGKKAAVGVFPTPEKPYLSGSPDNDSTEIYHDSETACGAAGSATSAHPGETVQRVKFWLTFSGIAVGAIVLYQKIISPWLPASCRFRPSCSQYAIEAIQVHGLCKGGILALWRILRCQPFCHGGFDPVPPPNNHHKN